MTHTLIVSYEPVPEGEGIEPTDPDLLEVSIECGGVTEPCRVWWECDECGDRLAFADQFWHDSITEGIYADEWRHGVEHKMIDGRPHTPGTTCYDLESDGATENGYEVARDRTLAAGRWTFTPDYVGDGCVGVDIDAPLAWSPPAYILRRLAAVSA